MAATTGPAYQQFNPFPAHEKPGYDNWLSLSQKQLQRQLDLIYTTELLSTSLPPPGTTKSDGPKEHLISHNMRLLLPRTSEKFPQKVFSDEEREGILWTYPLPRDRSCSRQISHRSAEVYFYISSRERGPEAVFDRQRAAATRRGEKSSNMVTMAGIFL
jgi:hypothetical protein